MPAERFTKRANTPKRKRQWQHVEDSAKARGLSAKEAVIEANGVLKREAGKKRGKRK